MEPTASGASWDDYKEWELCNDDGFVFRRPKRRRVDPDAESPASSSAAASDLTEDPEVLRRERKKNSLLRLKSRYQAEIDQWELLSSTLRAMEERSREQQQRQRRAEQEREPTAALGGCGSSELGGSGSDFGSVVDELLSQAEAHEAIIHDVSNLCDIAEAMCHAEAEEIAQSLFDLPIWASPRELMAALSDP